MRFYAYNLIASIYSEWERYQEALTHLLKAQAALNEIDSILNQGRRIYLINEMVLIQISLGQWQAAIETASSVLAEAIDAEYDWLAYDLLFSKYYAESALNDYEQAIETLRQVYRLADELALDFQKVIILNNFGDAYLKLDQLDKAESHLLEAREAAKSLEFIGMQQTIDYNLAFIAVKRGDSLGLKQMEEIAAAARNDETLTDYDVEETLEELAKAYAITENYQAQAATLNELLDLRKKIAEQTQQQQMNDLQAVYKSRDNAQQIALLEQQNKLNEQQLQNTQQQQLIWILAVAALIASALLVLLLYRKSYRMNQRLNDVNQELSERSIKDPLTGLNNRRAMQELMLKRDPTKDNNADALLLLDIDHFKKINDQHGHSIGDEVLKEIGRRLQEVCRASDMVVRWGGEEFLFFVRAVEPHHLQQFASRILTVIAQEPIRIGDEHINITTTLGFSPLPFAGLSEDQVDWERVLQIADMALYLGKTQGRNRACGVTALHVEYEQARKTLENDLSAAIEQGWVELTIIEGPAQ